MRTLKLTLAGHRMGPLDTVDGGINGDGNTTLVNDNRGGDKLLSARICPESVPSS